ncbi:G-protein coupled receptor Mth2-like isoform X2 [Formica exsecta]|uniref:G-protein coupled receptor Mth2-like isoform X2 n=1 Tax=Formica exsecta TaxID=72781 RepID=UPI001141F1DA|nr:G-protein coupled receptor Mth2-like isoform X2 [Formica exsecta]
MMCGKNFTFWYCALLLLVASSSKSQENSTSNEEKNDNLTIRNELDANSTTNYGDEMNTLRYDLYEKCTNNTQYDNSTQYESRITSTNNDYEDDDAIQYKLHMHSIHVDGKQIPMEPRTNLPNANHKTNFTSHEIYGNLMSIEDKNDSTSHKFYENSSKDSNINNIIPYEMCYNITCIQLCCPLGNRLVDNECIPEKNKYFFPYVYGYANDSLQSENKGVNELFQLVVYDPCQNEVRYLHPDGHQYDYVFFTNGSLYLSYYEIFAKSYCLAVVRGNKYEVTICSEISDKIVNIINDINIIYVSFHIVSILFLVSIFLVYSILPELRNTHGFFLCNYSGALSIAYTIHIVILLIEADAVHYSVCISIAFFNYLCYLVSFFWLNVMSLDMWWTFRGFCSLQRNVGQRDKRKLVFYTIFAWGLPFTFAVISVIMDFVSEYLPKILRPGFRAGNCWFAEKGTFALYYYGFKSICIISSICLSISTTLKIAHYEKETGNCLTDSESKRYNDNKKWYSDIFASMCDDLYFCRYIFFNIPVSSNDHLEVQSVSKAIYRAVYCDGHKMVDNDSVMVIWKYYVKFCLIYY